MSEFKDLAGRLASALEEQAMWACKRADGTYGSCWCSESCWKDGEPQRISCRRSEAALKDFYDEKKKECDDCGYIHKYCTCGDC